MQKIIKLFFVFIILFIFSVTAKAQPLTAQLYFCEKYQDGLEIGVNTTFTTGWIIVMLDLRSSNQIVGVNKLYIKITKVADKDGYYPDEIYIDRIPFDVGPDWDYLYFEDHDRINFKEPGIYRVYCLNDNGHEIGSAFLKVISHD